MPKSPWAGDPTLIAAWAIAIGLADELRYVNSKGTWILRAVAFHIRTRLEETPSEHWYQAAGTSDWVEDVYGYTREELNELEESKEELHTSI